ncbi:trafficking protein particle complex subunit 6B isoform X4 [Lagenorhynchus albirostris]|uniref:trafficking protein particle complex subunit 6B isoform X4 n=1 Tax=Lagenorhynchus albirostris TaxID=27610 RepID=UPI0028E90346|nr:trafficking protein particle complex subunit 6B isoform X4 [Lagenorhynchus albirostris]
MKSPPDGRFPPRLAAGGWARLLAQSRGGFENLWVHEDENGRCITKLENMGFRVGQGLIERFTKDTARFKDELDIMKFICKDFWTTVFKKQIDNLRTNHQGIYVLQDNKFRLLTQMSAGKQYLEHASKYLAFTCGLIRGGLLNLGIKSIVTAEVSSMPACKFQVMIQKL